MSVNDALVRAELRKHAPGDLAQSPANSLAKQYPRLVRNAVGNRQPNGLGLALVRFSGGLKLEGTLPDAQKACFRPGHAQLENMTSNDGSEYANNEQHPELRIAKGARGYCLLVKFYVATPTREAVQKPYDVSAYVVGDERVLFLIENGKVVFIGYSTDHYKTLEVLAEDQQRAAHRKATPHGATWGSYAPPAVPAPVSRGPFGWSPRNS
ncbi:MAG: hypothetical protein AAF355_14430 [Myxococcota bacterium]